MTLQLVPEAPVVMMEGLALATQQIISMTHVGSEHVTEESEEPVRTLLSYLPWDSPALCQSHLLSQ